MGRLRRVEKIGKGGGGSGSCAVDGGDSGRIVYFVGRYSSVSEYKGGGYSSNCSSAMGWSGYTPSNHYPWKNKALAETIYYTNGIYITPSVWGHATSL